MNSVLAGSLLALGAHSQMVSFPGATWGVYPGYEGDLRVSASAVSLSFSGSTVDLAWANLAADPNCTTPSNATNSCGIHVHEGMSCADAGGHYYNTTNNMTDPWLVAYYTPGAGSLSGIDLGLDAATSIGRTMVFHDLSGARIACEVIPEPVAESFAYTALTLPPYPGYEGNLTVSASSLNMAWTDTSVFIDYTDMVADPNCTTPNASAANSCGIHIHEGFSCGAAGGHFYDSNLPEDPWLVAYYMPGSGNLTVEYGENFQSSAGRALVVHDVTGARIGCTELRPQTSVPTYGPIAGTIEAYPNYTGSVAVSAGAVYVAFEDTSATITYFDLNADPACTSADPDAANSCGIHIHEGMACNASGAHFYNPDLSIDPWLVAYYMAGVDSGSVVVNHGFGYDDSIGRTLVVHDRTGARVACTVLGTPVPPPTPKPSIVPGMSDAVFGVLVAVGVLAAGAGGYFCFCRKKDGAEFTNLDTNQQGYGSNA